MSTLTSDERRRVFLARQEANREALARLSAPIAAAEPEPPRRRQLNLVLKAAMLAALVGTGWLAYQVVEFHPRMSLERMLPRV